MEEQPYLPLKYLKKRNWDAVIVPRSDEYLGEYIAPYAERLKWVSDFSGSAGKAIIKQNKAIVKYLNVGDLKSV